uniref:Thioredoxin domain-containing protein n=1 Tax=Ananas comosus var. bracteatus TaxID=296719 RepID=A0A6V7QY36_ANACO
MEEKKATAVTVARCGGCGRRNRPRFPTLLFLAQIKQQKSSPILVPNISIPLSNGARSLSLFFSLAPLRHFVAVVVVVVDDLDRAQTAPRLAGPRRAWGSVAASKEAAAARSPEPARAGLEAAAAAAAAATAEAVVGQVTEVGKDTFWPIVEAAEDKIVVLDMYTQWSRWMFVFVEEIPLDTLKYGSRIAAQVWPCKVIAPKFRELSEKYLDVVFLKLDCNNENKPLAKELGIRVVPTFKILKVARSSRK